MLSYPFFVSLVLATAAQPVLAQSAPALPSDIDTAIRGQYASPDAETRYLDGSIDLNGDGRPEVIVHVVGPMACGTGGCPTLVFTPTADGYRLVSTISVSRPPIGASKAVAHGWRNLVVHVAGGGARGHDAELRFDGTSYPRNPTVAGSGVTPASAGADLVIQPFDSFDQARLLPAAPPATGRAMAPTPVVFRCTGRENEPFTAAFDNQSNPGTAVFTMGDRKVVASSVRTASGARYQAPDVDFWEHQGEATVTWFGATLTCVPVK